MQIKNALVRSVQAGVVVIVVYFEVPGGDGDGGCAVEVICGRYLVTFYFYL